MSGIYTIYPEREVVLPQKIMSMAKDAFVEGNIPYIPEDVEDALFLLENAGLITVQDRGIY